VLLEDGLPINNLWDAFFAVSGEPGDDGLWHRLQRLGRGH
jgi:hypothetical protein